MKLLHYVLLSSALTLAGPLAAAHACHALQVL
jgi:hypothetical protein